MVDEVNRTCPVCGHEDVRAQMESCPICGTYMGVLAPVPEPEPVGVPLAVEEPAEPPPSQPDVLVKIQEPVPLETEEAPSPAICTNCSKELQNDWVACPYCGKPITGDVDRIVISLPQEPARVTPSLTGTEPAKPIPIEKPSISEPKLTPIPQKEPVRVEIPIRLPEPVRPTPIEKPKISKPRPTPIPLNADSWGDLLSFSLGVAILGGIVGGIVGILVGAVGSWTHDWPIVGAMFTGVIGLIWFGFGSLLVVKFLPNVISGRHELTWTLRAWSVVISFPIAGFGTWLTIAMSIYSNPWDGAFWLGLGSLSMGALIGAGFGLSPKQK